MRTIILQTLLCLTVVSIVSCQQQVQKQHTPAASFPGVTRDVASFCAARPSLPIDLASMIVQFKKNVSFNYKLYLFSADHVFQTGQVIPRDDFRIHSFPVKLKRISEFWPETVPTYQYTGPSAESLVSVSSKNFILKQFLRIVPMNPEKFKKSTISKQTIIERKIRKLKSTAHTRPPEDAHGDVLPGDKSFISHDVARVIEAKSSTEQMQFEDDHNDNFNRHIQFDRDDQLSVSPRIAHSVDYLVQSPESHPMYHSNHDHYDSLSANALTGDVVIPVGSFSSFHINLTYLVRKDFGQLEPQIIRIQVDAADFLVKRLHLISNGKQNVSSYPRNEDYEFLNHKILRDVNTRITSINQIYEDWITRNYYTIVYIQRRLDKTDQNNQQAIVNDRLVFRGTSIALIGADQLDYSVKAAAFITEKNGLHYYLEFLTTRRFYLSAVDWTKRPFKIIDSRNFPIKATKTQLDNEELLLCPPAVCYSDQPVDEIISYGRISLPDKVQKESAILSKSSLSLSTSSVKLGGLQAKETNIGTFESTTEPFNKISLVHTKHQMDLPNRFKDKQLVGEASEAALDMTISLDSVIEAVRIGSSQLQARLHLRDWVWILSRTDADRHQATALHNNSDTTKSLRKSFEFRYELARRNDIKVKPDTYGYALTGHEIDASYRIYNELYLISANHLITINYTSNETVLSSNPIGDEFFGLSSTLMNPITGAFYDRYANQIFFFKGDRYVGYDYATKKPLEDFLLQAPTSSIQDPLSVFIEAKPLVSSLPVVGILGRQHQVDGVYHDFFSDVVYIFSGMKFYTFEANDFKNGSFKPESRNLPRMYCINEHFLDGCNFDEAFQNPCRNDDEKNKEESGKLKLNGNTNQNFPLEQNGTKHETNTELNFNEEQQMKLRSIASRSGLLNLMVESTVLSKGAARAIEPFVGGTSAKPSEYQLQEKIIVYLLIAIIVLTVLVTVVMIVVIINWTKVNVATDRQQDGQLTNEQDSRSHYLINQQQHHSHLQQQYYRNDQPLARNPLTTRAGDKPLGTNCIKKDPSTYQEEFQVQYRHYESVLQILMFNPSYFDKEFESLVMFLAHTCPCYKKQMNSFPEQLKNLLKNYSTGLHRASRLACCKALMVLRSKSFIELKDLLPLFFELSRCQDKSLRSYIRQNIISDIKAMNKKSHNDKINKELQRFMFVTLANDQQEIAAKMALEIMIELYKKNVWRNKELINQIAQACLSRSTKILVTALQFFLGTDDIDIEEEKGSSDEEDDRRDALNQLKDTLMANRFNKSTRKRQKLLDRVKKTVRTVQNKEKKVETFNFSALHFINDPQTLAEKILLYLESTGEKFEVKLMLINLISRLIGIHDLILLNFYPYITKYIQPHQTDVTKVLQYAAQSAHKDVPPHELEPILKAITNNFVNEKNSTEAITVGLNSIRELCARNPLVMDEDLLQDLVQYQKYKNKNVSIAAKSLVYLFRIKNPDLLSKKDRGKPTMATQELKAPQYGQANAVPYIAGAEALNDSKTSSRSIKRSHSMISSGEEDMDIEDDEEMDISSADEILDSDGFESYEDFDQDLKVNYDDDGENDGDDDDDGDADDEFNDQEILEDLNKMHPEVARKKAEHISTERILTNKEIKKIKAAQMAKHLFAAQPKRMTRKDETTREVIQGTLSAGDRVKLEDIERIYKKPKHNKESRLVTVIDGREGREKYGTRKPKLNENASTSNRDKRRNKAFGMIKHKLKRHTKKKTFQQKQLELRQKMLNREKGRKK